MYKKKLVIGLTMLSSALFAGISAQAAGSATSYTYNGTLTFYQCLFRRGCDVKWRISYTHSKC